MSNGAPGYHSMAPECAPMSPPPDFREGDVAILRCPGCNQPVHITEFGPDGVPLPDEREAPIGEYVAAHFDVFHPWRFRLIRWLSFGWLP